MNTRIPVSAGLHRFNGGIVFEDAHGESTREPVAVLPIPAELILPLKQHIGEACTPLVKSGDQVLKGQLIAEAANYISAPVHAPTSGTVMAIEDRDVPHPSGLSAPCVVIKTDGLDQWREREPVTDYRSLDRSHLRNLIRAAGIVGLGGAAFPTSVKLNPGPGHTIDTFIVNAAECEPYINCDEMLIRERAKEILDGIDIARYCLNVTRCKIGIEDNMPEAYVAFERAIKQSGKQDIELVVVPTRYPTGGEKQLIKAITGLEVPKDGLPADIGIVCHNVGTLYAIARAILHDEPLLSRIVTVTGKGVRQPRNVEALFGTPLANLVEFCGGYTPEVSRLLMGGHMMGFALHSDNLPLVKAANCLLAATREEFPEPGNAKPCIRCGMCEQVCPANLLPQQLYWYARAKDFEKTEAYNLFDCIECGCCAYVCPSEIPLVQYYRYAKAEIANNVLEREKSDIARQRFEFRQERLEREQREKAEQMRKRKEALSNKQDGNAKAAIQAALERARARKDQLKKSENADNTLDS